MRKLFSFNMVTLDGFFEGPTPWSIDWHNTDDEFNEFVNQQMQTYDTIIFGRRTYEGMAAYWTSDDALQQDPGFVVDFMNSRPKYVVSKTLREATWNNSHIVDDDLAQRIQGIKQQPGKDIGVLGSANLLGTLIRLNLVDEHRVMVNPVVLGKGTPLFNSVDAPFKLTLTDTRSFKNGNVLLTYRPAE